MMIFPLIDEFVVIQYINFQPMSHFFKNGWVLPIWDPRHGPSLRPRFGPSDLGGALHPLVDYQQRVMILEDLGRFRGVKNIGRSMNYWLVVSNITFFIFP